MRIYLLQRGGEQAREEAQVCVFERRVLAGWCGVYDVYARSSVR